MADGSRLFARYAFPPNELGFCGPADTGALLRAGAATPPVARQFDGVWPYLQAIAAAIGADDPLAPDVVRSYWVGGPGLGAVASGDLLTRLRSAFAGQVTGLLYGTVDPRHVLAHHSFHVLVVYPWVRFLDRDPTVALGILQNCRIRWGTVESVEDEHLWMRSRPLTLAAGALVLGDAVSERVRWCRDGAALTGEPAVGDVVSAHWDWVCDSLGPAELAALRDATGHTLELVDAARIRPAATAETRPGRGTRDTSSRETGAVVSSGGP
ncbi:DUF6390 family protein [Mycolicibacterium vaccae]|uniref:DUF6390 family protein n=1 Tax=Mycolicibacterium vaccae TaxID=1810 RepID=UPI003D00D583